MVTPHAIADKGALVLRGALLSANEQVRKFLRLGSIRVALESGGSPAVQLVPSWEIGERYLQSVLPALFRDILERSAEEAEIQGLRKAKRFGAAHKLDVTSHYVIDWIRRESGNTIQAWGDSNKAGFRRILEEGYNKGMSTSQLARWLKNSGIGLDDRSAKAVSNYRRRLEAQGMDPAKVERMAWRYSQRLERLRADRIAKTESLRAAHEGQLQYLHQLQRDGLLSMATLWEWIASMDERTCPICGELDGETASIGGIFPGGFKVPPDPHPSCRCSLRLVAPSEGRGND